ncbi:MAG: enolase C-terminal domain-like protein [Chloroflexota bacterium]
MQIRKAEVTPLELQLRQPVRMAGLPDIKQITAIFVRLETNEGLNAWGCAVSHPHLTGEKPEQVLRACQACADMAPDLHPTNLEYSLAQLAPAARAAPSALCAFDLAFHDLLGLVSGLPLYRLLGGFRSRIPTSATVPLSSLQDSVEVANARARLGFRMLKIKGGLDPEEDVRRVRAIHRALPHHTLRLDADGGYTVRDALEIANALEDELEMLEQPTPADDLEALRQVTRASPIPIIADQSLSGPESALKLASQRAANGLSVKIATCGGFRCAQQINAIASAARLATMVGCVVEPALLTAAGLSLALSSPNVRYCDLDGYLDVQADPTRPGFRLEDGWLEASDVPGLGCTVAL